MTDDLRNGSVTACETVASTARWRGECQHNADARYCAHCNPGEDGQVMVMDSTIGGWRWVDHPVSGGDQ